MRLPVWDLEDPMQEGDGECIVRLWKFLYCIVSRKDKDALEAMSLLCDINIAFSEKQACDLKWNHTLAIHMKEYTKKTWLDYSLRGLCT